MDQYKDFFVKHSAKIINRFVTEVLYNEIIDNQSEYFRQENIEIYDNEECLSTENFSTKIILIWTRYLHETPEVREILGHMYKVLYPVVGFNILDLQTMILTTLMNCIFKIRFKTDSGEVDVPVIIRINFPNVCKDINEAVLNSVGN